MHTQKAKAIQIDYARRGLSSAPSHIVLLAEFALSAWHKLVAAAARKDGDLSAESPPLFVGALDEEISYSSGRSLMSSGAL